jgi:predicted alpha/beta superfamily hydrolase
MFFKYLFFLLISLNVFSVEQSLIINIPAGSSDESFYITGDFCDWKPDCLKLGSLNDFSIKIPLLNEWKGSKIKITKGSWELEACDRNGQALPDIKLNEYKSLQVINIHSWCNSNLDQGESFHFYYFFQSLKKYRRVNIYIPKDYSYDPIDSSFVLFLDGQNTFDATRSAFGYEWRADEAVEKLQLNSKILVSIDNGGKYRTEEYHYFKKGKDFSREISNEFLKSLCEEFFLKSKCVGNIIVGSSLGAIFAFTTSFSYPEVFSKSISLSFPAFAYDDFVFRFLDEQSGIPSNQNIFYFDFGGLGQDRNYGEHFKRFLNKTEVQKLNFIWNKFPYHGHNELNWGQRLPFIFKQMIFKDLFSM